MTLIEGTTMERHTAKLFECLRCGRNNYFLVTVVQKDGQAYYLTQCPKCKAYDEVKEISENEYKIYNRNV